MRRQARDQAGGARCLRTATALQVWLWLLIFVFQNEFRISKSIQPGYLDFDNLPETNFTCAGKVIGGYYADLETSCQMFHVCTVGQQDEPMDIKFLCLNGTVFDQETRVCERVDEVDCTKSEKFYSLNLELYGSTAPPIIQPEQIKPKTIEQPSQVVEAEAESDPSIDGLTRHVNENNRSPEVHDSTEDPPQDGSSDQDHGRHPSKVYQTHPALDHFSSHVDPSEDSQEEEEDDSENPEYEDFTPAPSTTTTVATTTSTKPPTTTIIYITSQSSATAAVSAEPSGQTTLLSAPAPSVLLSAPTSTSRPIGSFAYQASPSGPTLPNKSLDPAFLTPEQFIYQHRGPGSEAISFQRQSSRPEGLYITHAPSQQFDHFQYESSRTAPRSPSIRTNVFAQRPQPAPFRPTTPNPRDQLLRPGPASQPSERHETTVKHRHSNSPLSALPASRPLPLEPFHLEYKRHQESRSENQASLSARSAGPPTHTTRIPPKPKSPPKIIVTASASVSDSNGKKLNYTVGNVVSAVKPIVQINYDDYKESDLIFDPFFLDVPKLQKRRKERSNDKIIVTVPPTTTSSPTVTSPKISTTNEAPASIMSTTTAAWNPNDYVDDNYEPQAYVPAVPPLVALLSLEKKYSTEKQPNKNNVKDEYKSKILNTEQQKPTLLVTRTQTPSSQSPMQVAMPTPARIKRVAPVAIRNLHTVGFVSS